MSPAYQKKELRENLGNVEIVFNKYHAVAMVVDTVEKIRKNKANQGENEFKMKLKASHWKFRKNLSNLTKSQTEQLKEFDLEN